ncbi:hypothetical protein HOLleu_18373 [Holothuria leucospilota]|uniref:Uncharacterized protein n=1 Tax=Holothuria leucospilota TaxID=206669 RepID=A0A9Q1C3Z4_HOLLE|nr:hypothetical protein HOLleu_18373 [Holothuria leucospilota]
MTSDKTMDLSRELLEQLPDLSRSIRTNENIRIICEGSMKPALFNVSLGYSRNNTLFVIKERCPSAKQNNTGSTTVTDVRRFSMVSCLQWKPLIDIKAQVYLESKSITKENI